MKSYRYEDTDRWIEKALPSQNEMKKYVTFEKLMKVWELQSKSAVGHRLEHLVEIGKAERFKVGKQWHYHIIEDK